MFVDTHCHLNIMVENKKFDEALQPEHYVEIDAIVAAAQAAGVQTIINVGTSLIESINSVLLAKRYAQVYATVGIHPTDVGDLWRDDVRAIAQYARSAYEHKIVGIGEIGLDFYHKPYNEQRQKDAFKAQIELALEYNLGLSIHVRDAGDETLRVLEEYSKEIKRAVIHCFAQNKDFADVVIGWGFYLGIDAPLTYPKNVMLRDIVAQVPLDHLVFETDSPFLPPQEFRGKKNFPAYIAQFAPLMAELKSVSLDECAHKTTLNARRLFNLAAFEN